MSAWEIISSVAAAFAAVFAGIQILLSRKESRLRTTFEHIREVTKHLEPVLFYDASELQQDVLAFYNRKNDHLSEKAQKYLSFLNAADLLALAVEKKTVDRKIVAEYLRTLFNEDLISGCFLAQFRKSCRDDEVYRHLYNLLRSIGAAPKSPDYA